MTVSATLQRNSGLRRAALALAALTVAWNIAEGLIAIFSGIAAESIALVGFGLDSFVEVFAATIVIWRMTMKAEEDDAAERRAVFLIGLSFFALATYLVVDSGRALLYADEPDASRVGIVLALVSLAVMPMLAVAKRTVAGHLDSRALQVESSETFICAYLSLVLVSGLAFNAAFGWWWADPVAALVMVPLIAREGWSAVVKREVCCK